MMSFVFSGLHAVQSLVFCVVCRSLLVYVFYCPFSVLQFTASDSSFVIFRLFKVWNRLNCNFDILYTPVVLLLNVMNIIIMMFVCLMVVNATFNNISVISWRSVLLVEETGVPGEKHRPAAIH
jgi:hypothetical protein